MDMDSNYLNSMFPEMFSNNVGDVESCSFMNILNNQNKLKDIEESFDKDNIWKDFQSVDVQNSTTDNQDSNWDEFGQMDFIDEFLNLDDQANFNGIVADPSSKKPSREVQQPRHADKEKHLKIIASDHSYAQSKNTTSTEEMKCAQSPIHSDSGISSGTGSPPHEFNGNRNSPRLFSEELISSPESKNKIIDDKGITTTTVMNGQECSFDFSEVDFTNFVFTPKPGQNAVSSSASSPPSESDFSDLFTIEPSLLRKTNTSCISDSTSEISDTVSELSSVSTHNTNNNTPTAVKAVKSTKDFICQLPNFTPLVLTAEESKLLEEEGVRIPTDLPLTKYEERVLKKVRRKIRNKKSAMVSRQKKKDYVEGLEERVAQCTGLNQSLSRRVLELEAQNESLINQLKKVHDLIKVSSHKTTQATTCLMVLLLSCGLFLSPSYGPFGANPEQQDKPDEASAATGVHLSRKVLEYQSAQSPAAPAAGGYKMPVFSDVYDVPITTQPEDIDMPEVVSRMRRNVIVPNDVVVAADVKNIPKLENVTSPAAAAEGGGGAAAGGGAPAKSRKKRDLTIDFVDLTEDDDEIVIAPPASKRIKMEPVLDMSPTTAQLFAGGDAMVAAHTVVKMEPDPVARLEI